MHMTFTEDELPFGRQRKKERGKPGMKKKIEEKGNQKVEGKDHSFSFNLCLYSCVEVHFGSNVLAPLK